MIESRAIDLASLIEPVQKIAQEASRRILEIYASSFSINIKADQSPVTAADLASHDCIIGGLKALTPDIPVLSEEASDVSFPERRGWKCLWLVDPLDGTREFIRRNDQFSINIALVIGHEAVFGLILSPVSGVCYYACSTSGAFKKSPNKLLPQRIYTARVCQYPVRVISSYSSYRTRCFQEYLGHLGYYEHLALGGALKSCLIAEGKADLYPRFGPTGEWDTAAAQVILEQAGGYMTDMQLRPLRYNVSPILINPDFFAFGDPTHNWFEYLAKLANN
jgi:3'(2'), 5'-bisphosphate nucleotidase